MMPRWDRPIEDGIVSPVKVQQSNVRVTLVISNWPNRCITWVLVFNLRIPARNQEDSQLCLFQLLEVVVRDRG